ncbi:unnamed protein product [Owenia fusiformis]|uniref:BTB domain-containing protein n=1 Tax=Owenia fusiformis TaxID=6347 RepID=A0A8S4PTW0_OWEFU|nr:unnamed protein product [Owenia fusiformis]
MTVKHHQSGSTLIMEDTHHKELHKLLETSLDKRVVINVGGQKFETFVSTLERLPNTRLSLLAQNLEADESYDPLTREYYFDRHPAAFAAILQYYRSEELHVDQNICGNVMKTEMSFWGLNELDIEPCCWVSYSKFTDHKETLAALDDNFLFDFHDEYAWEKGESYWRMLRRKAWRFMEDPGSSKAAKAYAVISMFFVVLSIGVFVMETHPLMRVVDENYNATIASTPSTMYTTSVGQSCCCSDSSGPPAKSPIIPGYKPHPAMEYVDYVCVGFFTIEVILRFALAPKKLIFLKDLLNMIDILCLLPHYTSIVLANSGDVTGGIAASAVKAVLAARIIRMLRIFKLAKHYSAFKILAYTIKVSTKELMLMVMFLFVGVLIFASLIYIVEPNNFGNIPLGFWWALVTMTTVGYGDIYPEETLGYVIGSMCVWCGVLTIAFTVPIVVNNFTLYYSHAQSRIKLPKGKKPKRKKLRRGASEHSVDTNDTPREGGDTPVIKLINGFPETPDKSKINNKNLNNLNIQPQTKETFKYQKLHNSKEMQSVKRPPYGNQSSRHHRVSHGKPEHGVVTISDTIMEDHEVHCESESAPSLSSSLDNSGIAASYKNEMQLHQKESERLLSDLNDVNKKAQNEMERQKRLMKERVERRKLEQKEAESKRQINEREKRKNQQDIETGESESSCEEPDDKEEEVTTPQPPTKEKKRKKGKPKKENNMCDDKVVIEKEGQKVKKKKRAKVSKQK